MLDGSVPEATLDAMVTHILTAMFRIGLFDHPLPNPADGQGRRRQHPGAPRPLDEDRDRRDRPAQERPRAAAASARAGVRSIAVIGDAASEHPQTAAGGSATVLPSRPIVTPLAGITARAGSGVRVTHAQGTLGVASAAARRPGQRLRQRPDGDLLREPRPVRPADRHRARVPNLDYTGNPAAVVGQPVWSARYTGTLTAPATGDYRFSLSGGGHRPRVDRRAAGGQLRAVPRAHRERPDPPDRRSRTRSASRSLRSRPPWSRSTSSRSPRACTWAGSRRRT